MLFVAKKINDKFAFQLSPSLVFSDFENYDKHSFFIVGAAGKYMLSKRMALNIEYFYRLKHENVNSVGYINIFENNKFIISDISFVEILETLKDKIPNVEGFIFLCEK